MEWNGAVHQGFPCPQVRVLMKSLFHSMSNKSSINASPVSITTVILLSVKVFVIIPRHDIQSVIPAWCREGHKVQLLLLRDCSL